METPSKFKISDADTLPRHACAVLPFKSSPG